ncbi:uncharacterized protein METZ01_LOCUS449824 [marine metagenome]|uniref:Uncharacterized protein n=1 Tax=marine metagenome TaxID=408172 RepID=A0A382ZNV2_9ZZZZ
MRREEETPQAFGGLQQAVSDIYSRLASLAEFSKGIIDGAPVAGRPDSANTHLHSASLLS